MKNVMKISQIRDLRNQALRDLEDAVDRYEKALHREMESARARKESALVQAFLSGRLNDPLWIQEFDAVLRDEDQRLDVINEKREELHALSRHL